MWWLLLIFALAVFPCLVYFWLRRVLAEFVRLIKQGRPLVLDVFSWWERLVLSPLRPFVHETNLIIARDQENQVKQFSTRKQIEATLMNMREAVLILDDNNCVLLVNPAGEQLFAAEGRVEGKRIELLMNKARVSEITRNIRLENLAVAEEVDCELGGKRHWFELSAARIPSLTSREEHLVLLVLHDITRLKALQEVRKEFVANVSHELRTPVTILKGFADTLVEDGESLPAESRQRFLKKIQNSTERLYYLVEDLLVLCRLESTEDYRLSDQPQKTVAEVVELVHENYEQRCLDAGVNLAWQVSNEAKTWSFDFVRLTQVLENLLENALRHGKTVSLVRVTIEKRGKGIHCVVEDNGSGIPVDALPHVFERFYRADKGRGREQGGTGLGLSIIKHIVQQNGGEVWAESELGQYTRIHFTLFSLA